ncbi:hypothetical protein Tco_0802226 [Tanacetum coccineum]|uniref:Xylulose kinase-1 n=1 Tax=Tanacetum coccineum TaxID=301880 RepID=A0ABQ5A2H2_9ASTR
MSDLKFADTHNLVAFLSKPAKSKGFEQIVDFLNANPIKYALTINPTIYTSCIKQFWGTIKVKTVNEEVQLHALVDRKKVIITESTIRRDLQLEDAEGTACLPNATIFEQLIHMGYEKLSQKRTFYKAFFSPQWKNIKREEKGFSGRVTPLFLTMMVQAQEEMGEGSANPADPHHTPIITQPSTSKPQKKQKPGKPKRKDTEIPQFNGSTEPIADEAANEENVLTHSNDPLLSDCSSIGDFNFEVESQEEDASKQGRKIDDIDKDAEVTLVDETYGRYGDDLVFDTIILDGEEVFAGQDVVEKEVSTADPVTTAALAELRSAKPKIVVQEPVQRTTTIAPSTIPKAKSINFRDSSESTTRTTLTPIPSNIKDKGKAKMIEPEKPLKMKEQIRLDKELSFKLQVEEEEQARLAREKVEKVKEANISWDNVQAMIEADRLLAERLQAREQEELTDKKKA